MTTLPAEPVTASDLLLSPDLSEHDAQQYLAARGFQNPDVADTHLQTLAADLPTRHALATVADILIDALADSADPDTALVGVTRYLAARTPARSFLSYLKDDPRAAQILAQLMGTSPSLGEILIRNPEYLHWLQLALKRAFPDRIEYDEALEKLLGAETTSEVRLDAVKRFRRREYLGVAARDVLGATDVVAATRQLSLLADTVIDAALELVTEEVCAATGLTASPGTFAVVGMGKLGGLELNYSSNIDLIYLYDPTDAASSRDHQFFHKLARRLTRALGDHTAESYLYRVDLRLRPMGRHGKVTCTLAQCAHYYEALGETFERFALIKARVVAGNHELGESFLDLVQPFVYRKYLDHAAFEEIARYKRQAERTADADRDVKVGWGGIREIELFAQMLQVTYGADHPGVRSPTTLTALAALRDAGIIDADVHRKLDDAYRVLRLVEHRLQIVHQRRTHTLEGSHADLEISARRMGFPSRDAMDTTLTRHRDNVHQIYVDLLTTTDSARDGRWLFRLLQGEISDDDATNG